MDGFPKLRRSVIVRNMSPLTGLVILMAVCTKIAPLTGLEPDGGSGMEARATSGTGNEQVRVGAAIGKGCVRFHFPWDSAFRILAFQRFSGFPLALKTGDAWRNAGAFKTLGGAIVDCED